MPPVGIDWFPAIWIGGGLFGISVFLVGYLTPGYSHFHQSISELGARNSPWSGLMRYAGFIPLGSSFVLFSHQTRDLFSTQVPYVLFLLIGLAVVTAGIFSTDPHNGRDTMSGKIHAIAAISLLTLLSLAPFALSFPALYRNPPAIWFLVFSFLMGTLTLGFFLILPKGESQVRTTLQPKAQQGFFTVWYSLHGLHQRIFLLLHSIWWLFCSLVLTYTTA